MKITSKTQVCALVGDPIAHSISPQIQNAAFKYLDLDFIYTSFCVRRKFLDAAIAAIRALGLKGVNVTMPYKTDVIKHLDDLDEMSRITESVNTILNNDGELIGFTTDGLGALEALKFDGCTVSGKKVLILGAGGAARSISFALGKKASEIVILNRTLLNARKLADNLVKSPTTESAIRFGELEFASVNKELESSDILVNATSVGMTPNDTLIPLDPSLLHRKLVVLDLVYEPLETRLLEEARKAGSRVVNGLSVLVFQGALSFEIWTGFKAPVDIMLKTAFEEINYRI